MTRTPTSPITQLLWGTVGCSMVSAYALQAAAQDADEEQLAQTQQEQTAEERTTLEEIVVTARKREESLQDVPFSINAQTEAELRDKGADSLEDVANNVAGFTIQDLGPGQSQVAIRGVSAGQIVRDQPGVKEQVGIYLDESSISLSLFTPDLDFFDMSRVEVLRGPQGTLFGSGSLSGTVRYITNKPNFNDFELITEMSGSIIDGGGAGAEAKGVVNIPFSDKVAVRAVAYGKRFGGFIDSVQPEGRTRQPGGDFRGGRVNDVNDGSRIGGRLTLEAQPTSNLMIRPRVIYQEVETDGFNREDRFNILANPFTTTREPVELGEREQFTQLEETFSDEFLMADLELEYDFGPVTFKSISSYTDRDILQIRDSTQLTGSITFQVFGAPESIFTLDAPLFDSTKVEVFTQEARVSNSDPTDRLRWTLGVFYTDMDREFGQTLDVTGFEDLLAATTGTEIPTAGPLAPKDVLFFSDIPFNFEQFAVFGEGSYRLTDRLDFTFGFRWFDFEETRELNFDGIFAATTIAEPGETSSDGFNPRVMASYDLTDDLSVNAQVSKGFRLGGINDPLNEPLCSPQDLETFGGRPDFEDEELWNFEVGSKGQFFDGMVTANVAAFWNDIENLQVTTDAGTCSSRIIFNVPDARSIGAEFEVTLRPTSQWQFGVSGSYTDPELRSTITSVDEQGNEQVVDGIEKGNRLPTVPQFQLSAHTTFTQPVTREIDGFVSATFQHVGSRFTQVSDQREGFGSVDLTQIPIGAPSADTFNFDPELDAYQIGNLRVGVRTDEWETAFWVNNIWDESAELSLDRERGTLARVGLITNQPRTFGITFRGNF